MKTETMKEIEDHINKIREKLDEMPTQIHESHAIFTDALIDHLYDEGMISPRQKDDILAMPSLYCTKDDLMEEYFDVAQYSIEIIEGKLGEITEEFEAYQYNTVNVIDDFISFCTEINNYGTQEEKLKAFEKIANSVTIDDLPLSKGDI